MKMRKKLGIESKEHYEAIKILNERYNAKFEVLGGNKKKGEHYADLVLKDVLIEVEMAVDKNKKFWWKNKKVILYLILPEEIENDLLGLYYIDRNGKEIKIK